MEANLQSHLLTFGLGRDMVSYPAKCKEGGINSVVVSMKMAFIGPQEVALLGGVDLIYFVFVCFWKGLWKSVKRSW